MKVAIYTRVSTQEQATSGASLDEQRVLCEAEAKTHGFENPKVFTDPGYSGKSMDRPGIKALIKYKPDVVIVWNLDRLSRNIIDFLPILERYKLISVSEKIDMTTLSGRRYAQMKGLVSDWEREDIRLRTEMGRKRAIREGRPPGKAPFGYRRAQDKSIERDPATYPVLEKIFKLRNEGVSGYTIAREVGLPSGTIYNILSSKRYGKRTFVKKSGQSKRDPKYELTGIIICPECKYRLGVAGYGKQLSCPRGHFNIHYQKAWGQITAVVEAELQDHWYTRGEKKDSREPELNTRIVEVEGKVARMTEAYVAGALTLDEFKFHKEPLDNQLANLNKELDKEREKELEEEQHADALRFIDVFYEQVEYGNIVFINRFLRILFPRGFNPFPQAPRNEGGLKRPDIISMRDILSQLSEM